jgi:hypothetical protein
MWLCEMSRHLNYVVFVLFLLAIALQSSALKVITKLLHDNEATTSLMRFPSIKEGSLWPWSHGSWIYNYLLSTSALLFYRVKVMMFNGTFNNISVISWRSVLLVQETVVPGENHRPVASHWQTLSHNAESYFKLRSLVVICTDCISSCKSNIL